jgi:hypothetical protein
MHKITVVGVVLYVCGAWSKTNGDMTDACDLWSETSKERHHFVKSNLYGSDDGVWLTETIFSFELCPLSNFLTKNDVSEASSGSVFRQRRA